jgi:hypothetical protein
MLSLPAPPRNIATVLDICVWSGQRCRDIDLDRPSFPAKTPISALPGAPDTTLPKALAFSAASATNVRIMLRANFIGSYERELTPSSPRWTPSRSENPTMSSRSDERKRRYDVEQ